MNTYDNRPPVLMRSEKLPWWAVPFIARFEPGRWGEWVALRHLRRLGWDILARNWKSRHAEADILAYDGPYLVIVEVKTRTFPALLPPENQISPEKVRKLEQLAMEFILRHELCGIAVRLDVIAVETTDRRSFSLRHYLDWEME
jgi:putative endonuclease